MARVIFDNITYNINSKVAPAVQFTNTDTKQT